MTSAQGLNLGLILVSTHGSSTERSDDCLTRSAACAILARGAMGIQVSIFGSSVTGAAPGWTKETVVSVLGSLKLDLSGSPPAEGARLTVVAVVGSNKIILPRGTRASVSGLSIVGSRNVKIAQGEGPAVSVAVYALFGATTIADER